MLQGGLSGGYTEGGGGVGGGGGRCLEGSGCFFGFSRSPCVGGGGGGTRFYRWILLYY